MPEAYCLASPERQPQPSASGIHVAQDECAGDDKTYEWDNISPRIPGIGLTGIERASDTNHHRLGHFPKIDFRLDLDPDDTAKSEARGDNRVEVEPDVLSDIDPHWYHNITCNGGIECQDDMPFDRFCM